MRHYQLLLVFKIVIDPSATSVNLSTRSCLCHRFRLWDRCVGRTLTFNITLFGSAAGHELKTHSVPIPALIYVVEGEGEFDLGSETVPVKSGSFIRMEPLLPHAVREKTPFRMLLVQVKDRSIQK